MMQQELMASDEGASNVIQLAASESIAYLKILDYPLW